MGDDPKPGYRLRSVIYVKYALYVLQHLGEVQLSAGILLPKMGRTISGVRVCSAAYST